MVQVKRDEAALSGPSWPTGFSHGSCSRARLQKAAGALRLRTHGVAQMTDRRLRWLALFFVASGFCGILYQIVWIRMAMASFGVITPVVSTVLSVFMLGFSVGSWVAGRWITWLTRVTAQPAILFYSLTELLIAMGSFSVPVLFRIGEQSLLSAGEMNSANYLFWSALILGGSIMPWCLCMGATLPIGMACAREGRRGNESSFSTLYLANVLGAMFGVIATALVLIELLGFRDTLRVAGVVNLAIALFAFALSRMENPRRFAQDSSPLEDTSLEPTPTVAQPREAPLGAAIILFSTGFCSMGMEVVWTRAFTHVLTTLVYSFSLIIFTYLLATLVGSALYRRHRREGGVARTSTLLEWLAVSGFLPILFADPRVTSTPVPLLASIFPVCAILGYLTPKLIDEESWGDPESAGKLYAVNALGCILGPLAASYGLLALVGMRDALILLALPAVLLVAARAWSKPRWAFACSRPLWSIALVAAPACFLSQSHEESAALEGSIVRRDHAATVVSSPVNEEGVRLGMTVNGVGITNRTTLTKVMAHLPMVCLEEKPRSALAICFGMGTTFRSLSTWDVEVTAVELVPSVKDAFADFFPDAGAILRKPGSRIVVDDGRRFLRRTNQQFDVITIDPPPPVEAAGSSLLMSEEFYQLAKDRLAEKGILQQWVPGCEPVIADAAESALRRTFPYVRAFPSFKQWGRHLLASASPIEVPGKDEAWARLPMAARTDLGEWEKRLAAKEVLVAILSQSAPSTALLAANERLTITDDRPLNEYFLLRRARQESVWRWPRLFQDYRTGRPPL